MDSWIWGAVGVGVTILNIVITRAVAIGSFNAKYERLSDDVKKLDEEVKGLMPAVRSYLFLEGGRTIYVNRSDCEREMEENRNHISRKIDDFARVVNKKIDRLDALIEEDRKEWNKTLLQIYKFMGRVEQHVKNGGSSGKPSVPPSD